MFTGIVQAQGIVRSVQRGPAGACLALDAPGLTRPIAHGSSIAVSGVCLTVTQSDHRSVAFDVVPETLSRSTLGALSRGDPVNLERSLRAGDPMDGHVVQGHVDGLAVVRRIATGPDGHLVSLASCPDVMPYIIPKGSVAVDGVSLTIASVDDAGFTVALIPTTLQGTTLSRLRPGSRVNIETDMLARTIVATLKRLQDTRQPLTIDMLRENGW